MRTPVHSVRHHRRAERSRILLQLEAYVDGDNAGYFTRVTQEIRMTFGAGGFMCSFSDLTRVYIANSDKYTWKRCSCEIRPFPKSRKKDN